MYMEPNNASINLWLLAQTANQKMKQNSQIQDADDMQAFFCVKFDTVMAFVSTIILSEVVVSEPRAPFVSAEAAATRQIDISSHSHTVTFFQ